MTKQTSKPVKLIQELSKIVYKQYPNNADKIIKRAIEINEQLLSENPNQTPSELMHTKEKIYPAISFYKAVFEITENKENAYNLIANNFNIQAEITNRKLKKLCNIPFIYKIVPRITDKIIRTIFGKKSGFDMIDYPNNKSKCHIDMIVCPYYSNCVKYGCLELGTAFCNSDDISYGNMHPKLIWGRTKTLARGNECCDFILEIHE